METIKNKNSNSYRTSIYINGKKIISPSFKRKTDCQTWLAERRKERSQRHLNSGIERCFDKITVDEYVKQWIETKRAQGLSRSTIENYQRYINIHLLPRFSGEDLRQIDKKKIEGLQLELRKNHNAKGVNVIITAIKGIFREAVKDGYLMKSPCEFIKSLKGDSQHDVYWTKAEIDQFLRANINNELYDFFLFAINTGMRKGEIAALCWDRVNFQDNIVTVTRTRDRHGLKERTKTCITRFIPMNSIIKATLLNLSKCRRSDSNYVFLDKTGLPIKTHHIYRDFEKAQAYAGLARRIRFHDLRHTFASQFVLNGNSIYDLQKILGHTSITMTQRYAHVSQEHLQKAMDRFELGFVPTSTATITTANKENENILIYKRNSLELPQNLPKIFEVKV